MRRLLRAALLLGLLAALAWGLRRSGVFAGDPWDPLTLRAWVERAGLWGPALYLLVATVKPLFVPQPLGLTWVAGGLFGVGLGGSLVAAAGVGSSLVGYAVGALGRRAVGQGLGQGRSLDAGRALLARVAGRRRSDWKTVALLRAVVPWDIVSYWAGARRLPLGPYLCGTGAALLPVSYGYAFAASALVGGRGAQVALAVPIALGLLFGPLWFFDRSGDLEGARD